MFCTPRNSVCKLPRHTHKRYRKYDALVKSLKYSKRTYNATKKLRKIVNIPEIHEVGAFPGHLCCIVIQHYLLQMVELKNLWNVDYEKDFFVAMKEAEKANRPAIELPVYSNLPKLQQIRSHLIMLQQYIADHERMSRNALHLGVYLFDIFISTINASMVNNYFAAGVCLFLAAKLEDTDNGVPTISTFNTYLNLSEPAKYVDYVKTEFNLMKMLEFKLTIPTAATFVDYFISAVVSPEDFTEENVVHFGTYEAFLTNAHLSVLSLLDSTLTDPVLVHEVPSKVAAACILLTRTNLHLCSVWPDVLSEMTKYTASDILLCASKIMNVSKASDLEKNSEFRSPDSGYNTTIANSPGSDSDLSLESSDESMSVDD